MALHMQCIARPGNSRSEHTGASIIPVGSTSLCCQALLTTIDALLLQPPAMSE